MQNLNAVHARRLARFRVCAMILFSFLATIFGSWKISYHVIDQHANQIVITEPRIYHEGFSVGSSNAEAINWADVDWTAKGYQACTVDPCGPEAITIDRMQFDLSSIDTQIKDTYNLLYDK